MLPYFTTIYRFVNLKGLDYHYFLIWRGLAILYIFLKKLWFSTEDELSFTNYTPYLSPNTNGDVILKGVNET